MAWTEKLSQGPGLPGGTSLEGKLWACLYFSATPLPRPFSALPTHRQLGPLGPGLGQLLRAGAFLPPSPTQYLKFIKRFPTFEMHSKIKGIQCNGRTVCSQTSWAAKRYKIGKLAHTFIIYPILEDTHSLPPETHAYWVLAGHPHCPEDNVPSPQQHNWIRLSQSAPRLGYQLGSSPFKPNSRKLKDKGLLPDLN